jgi:hypothetical protein
MNIVTQDPKAWEAGFKAGEQGIAVQSPYPAGSREDWSWHSGHVEGDAKRQGFQRRPPAMEAGSTNTVWERTDRLA